MSIAAEHAEAVIGLPTIYSVPFDRMLVAQAKPEPLILLTNDTILGRYGECVEIVLPTSRRR